VLEFAILSDIVASRAAFAFNPATLAAREDEIVHAEEEGINFMLLTNPVEFIGSSKGRVTGVKCMKMKLGAPDDSGRRRPIPVDGSEFTLDIDAAIIAIGNNPNPIIQKTTPGMEVTERGNIKAEADTMKTSERAVFAGGDIVSGAATVIEAMGMGRRAAAAIDEYIRTREWQP
jgi:glutamate synthase (NADPH/NADH) small chain